MELSKEDILHETHYGLTVYAYILRQYFPGETVLSLSGTDCRPAKNPFNGNKRTLQVSIHDNCARHSDTDVAIPAGDVFDFAQLHYNLNDKQLLQKINEDLHLGIGEDQFLHRSAKAKRLDQECQQITIPEFSFFKKPVSNVTPAKSVSLLEVYELLRCDRYKARTQKLRSLEQKDEARAFKAVSFDYVTISGTFNKRSDNELINHSGLLTIDFDHVQDIPALKKKLLADEYFETELLFTSPSGDGLKWIIPADLSGVSHQDYFKAVAAYILNSYNLEVDKSGKDISRACFLPHDPEVFINPLYLNFKF
jgi:hypothetical protein